HFIVLAARGENDRPPVLLQLHVSSDFLISDRVAVSGEDILRTRWRCEESGLWLPAAPVEFACVLANRLNKAELDDARAKRLSALWADDAERCREQLARLLPAGEAAVVAEAAASGDWTPVR